MHNLIHTGLLIVLILNSGINQFYTFFGLLTYLLSKATDSRICPTSATIRWCGASRQSSTPGRWVRAWRRDCATLSGFSLSLIPFLSCRISFSWNIFKRVKKAFLSHELHYDSNHFQKLIIAPYFWVAKVTSFGTNFLQYCMLQPWHSKWCSEIYIKEKISSRILVSATFIFS